MNIAHDGEVVRTDAWREGKWLDLWSVVHFLSGISIGLGLYFLQFGTLASIVCTFLVLISYEMWEMLVQIAEAPTNRFMDIVVGMVGFLFAFLILAPPLPSSPFILVFGFVLTANVVMSIFGWQASQKAAALSGRVRARIARQRARFLERRAQLRGKFRR